MALWSQSVWQLLVVVGAVAVAVWVVLVVVVAVARRRSLARPFLFAEEAAFSFALSSELICWRGFPLPSAGAVFVRVFFFICACSDYIDFAGHLPVGFVGWALWGTFVTTTGK